MIGLLRLLNEDTGFAAFDPEIYDYKGYADRRHPNREKQTREKTLYDDDNRNHDANGAKWLDISDRSDRTLLLAMIDGMCDKGRIDKSVYNTIKDDGGLDYVKWYYKDVRNLFKDLLDFLKPLMKEKRVTVYRGIRLSKETLENFLTKNPFVLTSRESLVKFISNEVKEFNSFTADRSVAEEFVGDYVKDNDEPYYVVMEGEADRGDINWAFTAYLIGRHGRISESELNINNNKQLKGLKIVKDNLPKNKAELEKGR